MTFRDIKNVSKKSLGGGKTSKNAEYSFQFYFDFNCRKSSKIFQNLIKRTLPVYLSLESSPYNRIIPT